LLESRTGEPELLDLSIVIVNYNTRNLLHDCLRSVLASQGELQYEVTVVDNASRDGSPSMVRQEYPSVHLVENVENEGYASANNRGLRRRAARYYLLLNPDTVLPPDALEEMLWVL
jgi:GT2 family glycosyltransferase